MSKPLPDIRRLSTGVIDIDFYRRQGVTERTACRTVVLRRLLTAAIAGPLAVNPLPRAASGRRPADPEIALGAPQ